MICNYDLPKVGLKGSLAHFVYAGYTIYGLAVDPKEEKLYIADYATHKIVVTNLDGSEDKTLKTSTGGPLSLVVNFNAR